MDVPLAEPKVKAGRVEFISALAFDLSRTWLASRVRIRRTLLRRLGRSTAWSEALCIAIHESFSTSEHADQLQLRQFLRRSSVVKKVFRNGRKLQFRQMVPGGPGAAIWPVPPAQSEAQLQDLLCLKSPIIIDWLTRPHRRRQTSVDHYRREVIRKRDGQIRLIEKPRPVIKRVQRKIAQHVLTEIPLHSSVHGFASGKSIFTAAAAHCGKRLVLCMDLKDFFGSVDRKRTAALFRRCGYPASVAYDLGCICTAPADPNADLPRLESFGLNKIELESFRQTLLSSSRLPQGAPTSPGIANAVAFRLDQRLDGLARSVEAVYTRYADDLIFSGNQRFAQSVSRFIPFVGAIAMEEGFAVNHRKTRRMFSGRRQSVLGLTVNENPTASRIQFHELKALLYNCVRFGPDSQNRDQLENFRDHLRGRISFVGTGNPNRNAKLLKLFDQIQWG